ncbi:type II toxin-antitoxin system RelE/ParE family toxin [Candidatus Woesearchaeota archaeon]|nr:type II toxin-antitoxin system RelE/ParE family toxin [Candidatus Woesearchaeota archaeon]
MYSLEVKQSCQKEIKKLCGKNPVLREALEKKITEILENPNHYKPLRHDLAGERRVHLLNCFVLKFEINEAPKIVTLIFLGHHDEAYRR